MAKSLWDYASQMSNEERDALLLGITYNEVHNRYGARGGYNVFGNGDPRKSRYWKLFMRYAKVLRERGWDFYSYLAVVYTRYYSYFGRRLYPTAIVSKWGINEYAKYLAQTPYDTHSLSYRELLRYYAREVKSLTKQWDISTKQAVDYLLEQGKITKQLGKDLLAILGSERRYYGERTGTETVLPVSV